MSKERMNFLLETMSKNGNGVKHKIIRVSFNENSKSAVDPPLLLGEQKQIDCKKI